MLVNRAFLFKEDQEISQQYYYIDFIPIHFHLKYFYNTTNNKKKTFHPISGNLFTLGYAVCISVWQFLFVRGGAIIIHDKLIW